MSTSPFDRFVAALRAQGCEVRASSENQVRARCPSHSDVKPSLVVTRLEDKVLLKCFAGCSAKRIAEALGLRMSDLFSRPAVAPAQRVISATYDYGSELQKIRYTPKGFGWRHKDSTQRSGWRWGFGGFVPGLYRRSELDGAHTIYVVEGEKSADRLAALSIIATCGYAGASTWKAEWSAALLDTGCRELVILADRDHAGERHAEQIALATHGLLEEGSVAIKVLTLPDLPPGGDVVDFLDTGHEVGELFTAVAGAPLWSPGAKEERRRLNRLEKAKARMRAYRARRRSRMPSQIRRVTDSDAAALTDVLARLDQAASGCSGRQILRAVMPHGHSRRAIVRALEDGLRAGVLAVTTRGQRGQAHLYQRAHAGSSVTGPAHFQATADQAVPHDPTSAPRKSTSNPPLSWSPLVRQRAVTPFAVTQGERTSNPLQEAVDYTIPTCVTEDGALVEDRSEHEKAIATGRCCGANGAELRCKLCRWSPTYLTVLRAAPTQVDQPVVLEGTRHG